MTDEQKKQIILQEFHSPAFPPELIQDKFGQLVAPLPGMTKLEYFSIAIHVENLKKGKPFSIEETILQAKLLIESLVNDRINQQQPPKPSLSLT